VVAKATTVLVAASIPVLSGFGPLLLGHAELATLIVVVEGILQLFQWEQHWLRYRGTWLVLYDEKKRAGSIGCTWSAAR
jgi:hypothetical protein